MSKHRHWMLLIYCSTFLLFHLRPNFPKSDCFISGDTGHCGVVGRRGEEQHPAGVARQVRHLHQGFRHVPRIFPDGQLVVAEPVTRDELLVLGVPHDGGHLGARVAVVELRHGARVPQPDGPVHGPARRGEDVGLPGTPGHGLDGGLVRGDRVQGPRVPAHAPHLDTVVVAPRGQSFTILRPREATNLLLVALKPRHLMLGHADIVENHQTITASTGKNMLVPINTSNPV